MNSLKDKLSRTREAVKSRIDEIFAGSRNRDELLEDLTETLILADVGIPTTEKIIRELRTRSRKTDSRTDLRALLLEEIMEILGPGASETALARSPSVAMMVGINGGGKTTSMAKLARYYRDKGKQVMMVAADTFRAAAAEQLIIWGKHLNIPVIRGQYGADPAAVTFDALQSFKSRALDLLLVDTAGRIHTNTNLMSELEKIRKVISREIAGAPQEVMLVLDASIGQNALIQAREFLKFSGLTGVFLSKLDGTAKGGSVLGIVDELRLPIKFIGIGEKETDMMPFSPREFAHALLS
jgi:fused signal recognition particle receptor